MILTDTSTLLFTTDKYQRHYKVAGERKKSIISNRASFGGQSSKGIRKHVQKSPYIVKDSVTMTKEMKIAKE